jgi:Zn-finger nucleic acid-binding protein
MTMPLLMCPNDNAPMQTLDRHGVQFDMCPTYAPPQQPPQQPWGSQPTYREPPRHRDDRYDHDRRRDDDYYHRKKKKRLDIFDIFD